MDHTVYVVDDDADVRSLARSILEMAGYGVEEAENGDELIELLKALGRPDAIFLDLTMPERSGWATLELLRSNSFWAKIPVIIVTSHADDQFRLGAERAGAVDYITKPFQRWQLVDTLRKVVGPKRDPKAV